MLNEQGHIYLFKNKLKNLSVKLLLLLRSMEYLKDFPNLTLYLENNFLALPYQSIIYKQKWKLFFFSKIK